MISGYSTSPNHCSPCASCQGEPVRRDHEQSANSCSRGSRARMLDHVSCFGGNTATRLTGSEAGSGASSSLSDLAKKGPLGAIFDHRLRAKAYIMLRMARMTHESCTKSLSPTGC